MIEMHVPFWKLLVYGAALYLGAVFMIRGQLLKHRLRREIVLKKRAAQATSSAAV
jgi:hypothetical protein